MRFRREINTTNVYNTILEPIEALMLRYCASALLSLLLKPNISRPGTTLLGTLPRLPMIITSVLLAHGVSRTISRTIRVGGNTTYTDPTQLQKNEMHGILPALATGFLVLQVICGSTGAQVYLLENNVTLTCYSDSTSDSLLYSWTDEANGIRFLSAGKAGEAERSTNEKYENFEVSSAGFPGSTQMIIKGIQLEDELGPYRCTPALGNAGDQLFDIQLEVPGTVNISDGSGLLTSLIVNEGSVYNLTCTATVAKSPNDLELTWTPGDGAGPTADTTYGNYSLVNYTRTIAYNASREDTSLSCILSGYVNDIDDELVSAVVDLTVRYVPVCTLTVITIDNDCRNVQLYCTCDAVPDESSCLFYRGSSLLADTSGCSWPTNVTYDTTTEYSCQATNDAGSGLRSEPVGHECVQECDPYFFGDGCSLSCDCNLEGSTGCNHVDGRCFCSSGYTGDRCEQAPTTTPSSTCSPTTGETSTCTCSGPIAGLVVESVIIALLLGVVGWFIFNITRDLTKGDRGDRDETHSGNSNSAYMDLHERNTSTDGEPLLLGVPAKNVKIISKLPGSGLMVFSKALLTTSSGNKDVVVKSTSEEVPVKVEKIWSAEMEARHNLPNDANLVKIMGWCNSVPRLLLFEYINGTNLMTHLTENFSMHEVHQYGNTRRMRFEVPETGRVENLPRYALDVARGLKFLLAKEFIHPGIRARKVLVDLSGKCKIYDFVSVNGAKGMTSLLWKESAPYQWMPPEFLFLDTVAPTGDVWSFGVLMWEIYSYGSQPFPGKDRSEVESILRMKERLAMPKNCPGAIWQLMNRCWDQSVDARPKIQEIASNLAAMCNDDKEYDVIPKGGIGNDQV